MKNKNYPLYEPPCIRDLKDMLELKRETQPEKAAFTFAEGRTHIVEKTYRDFYEEVNALGTWMYRQNIRNMHIAVVGENSYEWLLVFLAVVNGGNVAVPIDKELPPEEISKLMGKADVQAVFYSGSYKELVEKVAEQKNLDKLYSMEDIGTYLVQGRRYLDGGDRTYLDYSVDRERLCCIMFTSGTSGESKGVMLSHENIAEDTNGSCQLFELEGNTISVLPFHHAFGLVVGIFMLFNYGQTIHLSTSLKAIQRDLQISKPHTMFLVPLFVETFHKQIWMTVRKEKKDKLLKRLMRMSDLLLRFGIDIRRKCFAQVRQAFGGELIYIVCGGAPLGVQYVKEFRSWGIEVLNGYGTTECSPCAAVNRNHFHKDGTVGQPLPNVEIKIARDGEVLIKGPIVMSGYYKDTEASREVLKDGWYATGDLGTVDEDGFLTLTGRKKNLIILSNGENISPEELENDFLQDEAVREVLVYAKDKMIAAEIYPDMEFMETLETDINPQEYFEELRRKVNRSRPIYKQVGMIVLRDTEFPKNTSKKILRYKKQ